MLGNIFVLKNEKVTEEWRKLHNEEPHDLYSSQNIMREMEWRKMWWIRRRLQGVEEKRMQGLGGKTQGRRQLGRTRRGWSVILKWILKQENRLDLSGSGLGHT